MQKSATLVLIVLGIAIVGLLGALVYRDAPAHSAPALSTTFHGVLMMNGRSYFGRLEGLGTPYPVLRDVYYLRTQMNPDTKAVTNTLVKQGQEPHAPDVMILNASHIVLIEPVKSDSQIGKLIGESESKSAPSRK